MSRLRSLYSFMWADFLERIRRDSFLVVVAATIIVSYLAVPPAGAGYLILRLGYMRGVYNSAWVGLMLGLVVALLLPLPGFFLVKDAVERDRQTRVGQIIATTPTGKPAYLFGKWLSNLAVLAVILVVMTGMAAIMQLIRGEAPALDLGALVAPIWLMGLPVLAIAAALAILFETVPLLRGGLGNVVYFFLWTISLMVLLESMFDPATHLVRPGNDLLGFTQAYADVQRTILAAQPGANLGFGLIFPLDGHSASTFVWNGLGWTAAALLGRLAWFGLALLLVLAAAIPFDRFDPARSRPGRGAQTLAARLAQRIRRLRGATAAPPPEAAENEQPLTLAPAGRSLAGAAGQGRFFSLLLAELKLMLKGQNWLWYIGTAVLIVAALRSPAGALSHYLLAAEWLWPVLVWADLGTRESRWHTGRLVFSAPHSLARQLPAAWLAGVLFTLIAGSGVWIHLLLSGLLAGAMAWLVGALFAPALALALGVWAGNSRAFEAVYLGLWYFGVMNLVSVFDYAGAANEDLARGRPAVYLGLTALLLLAAAAGRWRQLRLGSA